MNALRVYQIAHKLFKETCNRYRIIQAFEMTEDEWRKYKKLHPNAKRENHLITHCKPRTHKNNKSENNKHINWGIPQGASIFQMEVSNALNTIRQIGKYDFLFQENVSESFINELNKYTAIKNLITTFDKTKGNYKDLEILMNLEKSQREILNRAVECGTNQNMEKLEIDNHMPIGDIEIIQQNPNLSPKDCPNDKKIFDEIYPIVFETVSRFCKMFSKQYNFDTGNRLKFYVSDTIHRPYHNEQDNIICLNASLKDVLFALDNVKKTTWRFSVAAMSHELAHNMEYVNPHIRKRCVEFLNYRTANKPPVSLNRLWLSSPHIKEEQKKIYPNGPYKRGETAKPDDFFDPYCGKTYPDGMTEIFSTGVEFLVTNPKKFKQIDPEYFYFIVGLMRGEL